MYERRQTHHRGGDARHSHLPRHSVGNFAEHRIFGVDGRVCDFRRRGAMADHRVSAVAFRGHSDVTVHGAQIPDQSVVCYGHRAVFRGNARRRARIELSDAA